jgi:hypothetical protein
MLNASILVLPDSSDQAASAASFVFDPPPGARSTRVGGVRGVEQMLRGTWHPMFPQPAGAPSSAAPQPVCNAPGEGPRVSLPWWRNFLQRLGIVAAAAPAADIPPAEEPSASSVIAAGDTIADFMPMQESRFTGDAAASYWEEQALAPGECIEIYAPAETRLMAAQQPRIGRSFLGAYRKGRRAAENGLSDKHCPYKARLEKEGRPVNALTRTFQRYWAEGLNDGLAGQPERYV